MFPEIQIREFVVAMIRASYCGGNVLVYFPSSSLREMLVQLFALD